VIERALVADYPDPDMGHYPMYHVVPRMSATPGSIRAPAPHLGEHNRELLRGVGVDDAAYEALRAAGAVLESGAGHQSDLPDMSPDGGPKG
jgi:formyl-CoA transferase